jgi:hypothetical protein
MDNADPGTAIFRKIIAQPPPLTNSARTCLLFNEGEDKVIRHTLGWLHTTSSLC